MKTGQTILLLDLVVMVPICLFMCGCSITANAIVPTAPALQATPQNVPRVNLSAVKDGRGTVKAGAIGAVSFDLKSGLNEYVQNSFANGLMHTGYAINSSAGLAPQEGVKTVVVTVQSASVASFDAILQPARGEVSIAVQIFGISETLLYARSYSGSYSETAGLHGQTGYEEDVGRIIATAADQAVSNALADPGFQTALKTVPAPSQAGAGQGPERKHVGS
jgi:hypothetical protein